MAPHQSSTGPLALACVLVIAYASLYPFTGWHWPAGAGLTDLLLPPWPRWHDRFDVWANFLGYLAPGALICLAGVRNGHPLRLSVLAGVLLPAGLSWSMEFTQHFLPGRVPSAMDWALNAGGGLVGALVGLALQAWGAIERWHAARQRWFTPGSGHVIALLLLWPLGFLFPSPLPFMQGPSWARLQEFAFEHLADHPWEPALEWMWSGLGTVGEPVAPATEALGVALGLLGPCLLAFSVMRRGWRRAALALGLLGLGLLANALSAALNFGPAHAWAWLTPWVPAALGAGLVLSLAGLPLGRRAAAALGLVVMSLGVALVAQAPSDPYFAESLAGWEQGAFIHFYGLAQWLGWFWPLAALLVLLLRLARPERAAAPVPTIGP